MQLTTNKNLQFREGRKLKTVSMGYERVRDQICGGEGVQEGRNKKVLRVRGWGRDCIQVRHAWDETLNWYGNKTGA